MPTLPGTRCSPGRQAGCGSKAWGKGRRQLRPNCCLEEQQPQLCPAPAHCLKHKLVSQGLVLLVLLLALSLFFHTVGSARCWHLTFACPAEITLTGFVWRDRKTWETARTHFPPPYTQATDKLAAGTSCKSVNGTSNNVSYTIVLLVNAASCRNEREDPHCA